MKALPILFDRWLPDLLPWELPEGGMITCENVIPQEEGYYPAYDIYPYSTTVLSGTPLSGKEYKASNGVYYVFCGTTTKLYRLESDKTATDVTRVINGDYTTGDDRWYFERFSDQVLATNYDDNIQSIADMTTGSFSALSGASGVVKARYLKMYYGHLVLANLNEAGTITPNGVRWSAIEDVTDWTKSLTTQSSNQTFPDKSEITGIAELNGLLVIFHQDSITIGWHQISAYAFAFDPHRYGNIGAIKGSVITIGETAYFWDTKEIYKFDGQTITPIGFGIKRSILDLVDSGNYHRITAAHDSRKGNIYWSWPSTSSGGTPDNILVYNYIRDRFALLKINHHCIFNIHRGLMTETDIDLVFPNADLIPHSAESSYWLSGEQMIGGVNTDLKISTLGGSYLTSKLVGKEINVGDKRVYIRKTRPRVERAAPGTVSVRIGKRMNEADSVLYTSAKTVDGTNGYANIKTSGRFIRPEVRTSSYHSGIRGITLYGRLGGTKGGYFGGFSA